jgi:hypothetical protein
MPLPETMPACRRGSVLVIVAGICAILLMFSVAFLMRMRTDSQESALVAQDTQARIMLVAAMQYIQESSRLGWRKPGGDPATDGNPGNEAFGWTDIRDGGIGPRGLRNLTSGKIPVPTWWTGGAYPDDLAVDPKKDPRNEFSYAEGGLPGIRRWPCPGSTVRGYMYMKTAPPCAVKMLKAPNGIEALPTVDPAPLIDSAYTLSNLQTHRDEYSARCVAAWLPFSNQMFNGGYRALDPQPVSDTWAEFRKGDPTPRSESTAMAWFRIYRELPSDHDNDGKFSNGSPCWWDRVPLKSHSAFIVACGAGATMGYRFWDTSDPGYDPSLEPVTAKASGLFPGENAFRMVSASQRILWYRIEWTANTGSGVDASENSGMSSRENTSRWILGGHYAGLRDVPITNRVASYFGAIKWIQRLEKDPVKW